jgi:hypothetical protein
MKGSSVEKKVEIGCFIAIYNDCVISVAWDQM